jgi:hypothetical protein
MNARGRRAHISYPAAYFVWLSPDDAALEPPTCKPEPVESPEYFCQAHQMITSPLLPGRRRRLSIFAFGTGVQKTTIGKLNPDGGLRQLRATREPLGGDHQERTACRAAHMSGRQKAVTGYGAER